MENQWQTGEPEKEGFYLVTITDSGEKTVTEAYYHPEHEKKWFKYDNNEFKWLVAKVTHWMLMPSPAED